MSKNPDAGCSKNGSLPASFLEDLEIAHAHALVSSGERPVVSVADLDALAEQLKTWRRRQQRVLRRLLDRLPSDDPIISPVSLFGAMEYGRLETAQTRTLAWLLDSREHGFGNRLLETLLPHLLEGRQIRLTRVDRVESEVLIGDGVTVPSGRIDVLAQGHWDESGSEVPWLLVIEAKIDADEGEDQLSRYDDWLRRYGESTEVVRVFLSPNGRAPLTGSAEWKPLSFDKLASIFGRALSGLENTPGYHFLRYYLTGLLRKVCRLPVPISADCQNPYVAVAYLQTVLGTDELKDIS